MQLAPNDFKYSFGLLKHFVVPEPQHTKSVCPKKRVSSRISQYLIGVLTAIDLNNKQRIKTGKVRYVRTDRNLPAKPAAADVPSAKVFPQALLCVRQLMPELSSSLLCDCVAHPALLEMPPP